MTLLLALLTLLALLLTTSDTIATIATIATIGPGTLFGCRAIELGVCDIHNTPSHKGAEQKDGVDSRRKRKSDHATVTG